MSDMADDESNVVIDIRDLTKVYKLYKNPQARTLDILGLLKNKESYTLNHALDKVNLKIHGGERVGVIGRNGAGKSTLLKIISGTIKPTGGTVTVKSKARAILQIGTGFHPDFTGRQNIIAYLSQLGLSQKAITAFMEDIIEFAEIEDYVDQPLKTYSTGMAARLMFSTTTAVAPELLILDEILSVGDAYFTQKSMDRIEKLCKRENSTLLLVSHDIYSTSQICERLIWIDKGQVLIDGDPNTVTKHYESSIRTQNERRLRLNTLKKIEENLQANTNQLSPYYGQVRCAAYEAIDKNLPIQALRLYCQGELLSEVTPHRESQNKNSAVIRDKREANWEETEVEGSNYLAFSTHGSVHHRAAFSVYLPPALNLEDGAVECEIEYFDGAQKKCFIEIFIKDHKRLQCELGNEGVNQWKTERHSFKLITEVEKITSRTARYGTQSFRFRNIRFLDKNGKEKHVFETGEKMVIRIDYEINDPEFDQRPTIQVNFLKDGVVRTHRFILQGRNFSYRDKREGTIEFVAERTLITKGRYLVNIVAMQEGGYSNRNNKTFFTVNPNLLDHHSRAYEIEITPTHYTLVDDTTFLHPVEVVKDGETVFKGTNYLDEEIWDLELDRKEFNRTV